MNLNDGSAAEKFIFSLWRAGKYKLSLLSAYLHYCKANAIACVPPRIKPTIRALRDFEQKKIDMIISCGRKNGAIRNINEPEIGLRLKTVTNSKQEFLAIQKWRKMEGIF